MQDLTLNGRNPIYLAALSPGVVGGTIGTIDPDSVSNGSFNINGGRPDEYIVVIDGAMATRTRSSGSMVGTLDVDTVQEAQVLSGNYSAEYGRSSGGQIRFVTKSGTRDFHGDLAENFRNSALDANTWTRNHSPQASTAAGPAPYRFNQYGFDVGGPIFIPNHFNSDRNKLFFFWGEEWVKRRYDTTNTGTVPSVAMRSGDFSELLNPANSFFGKVRVINDPTNGAPFPGNIIPSNRISHNGQALLNIFPLPVAGFQQGTTNWIGTKSTHSDFRKDTFKFDYLITDKQHLSVRAGYDPWHFNAPFEDTFGRMEEVWSRPNRVRAISLISTFSPTLVNETDGGDRCGFRSRDGRLRGECPAHAGGPTRRDPRRSRAREARRLHALGGQIRLSHCKRSRAQEMGAIQRRVDLGSEQGNLSGRYPAFRACLAAWCGCDADLPM